MFDLFLAMALYTDNITPSTPPLTHAAAAYIPPPLAENADAETAFAQLSDLVGVWKNQENPDSPLRIHFYLTAGGTVLVEEWLAGDRPHSLTLYHRDGDTLVATHYCPQGNQPRLNMVQAQAGQITFAFRDVTDLDDGESYQHDLRFDIRGADVLLRAEVYHQGEDSELTTLRLIRETENTPQQ